MKMILMILLSLSVGVLAQAETKSKASKNDFKITVYKSPTCGCCAKWEKHLRDNGFVVESKPTKDMVAVKSKYKVPNQLHACHTAVIGDYVVEGHVPADVIKKLVNEKPKATKGIATPGMPIGSPGMEGSDPEAYDVMAFAAEGSPTVFQHVEPAGLVKK